MGLRAILELWKNIIETLGVTGCYKGETRGREKNNSKLKRKECFRRKKKMKEQMKK